MQPPNASHVFLLSEGEKRKKKKGEEKYIAKRFIIPLLTLPPLEFVVSLTKSFFSA